MPQTQEEARLYWHRVSLGNNNCPRCEKELACLAGHSAHPDNWYCTRCGWAANLAIVGDTTGIVLSDFVITQRTPETVFIQHASGEGGEFCATAFERVVADFYKANF